MRFARELDVDQLARLMTGHEPNIERDGAELLSDWGDAIRGDLVCSSCGKQGARVVRSARSKSSRAILRQAHFRFVSADGGDAHHPFCEFHGNDGSAPSQAGLLDFGSDKSAETRNVRILVCKGIEQGIFDQRRIRSMRQWFFDKKSEGRFTIDLSPEALQWARFIQRHSHYGRWQFHPAQAEMPEFNWKAAAKSQFTEDNVHLFDLVKDMPHDERAWRLAHELVRMHQDKAVFDVTALQSQYEAAIQLSVFIASNSGLNFGKVRPAYYRIRGAPVALLALCALVLFVSDWNMDAAIEAFARLLASPMPSDLTSGNVIGLNPFHEFTAWRIVVAATNIASRSVNGFDYEGQLASTEDRLRERHRAWKSEQRPSHF